MSPSVESSTRPRRPMSASDAPESWCALPGRGATVLPVTTAPTIRLARPDDREDIWRLLNDLVITFPPERAAFDPTLDEILARPDMLVLVADAPDLGVVGYLVASCRASLIANGREVWVAELIADQRVRRTGVGRALILDPPVGFLVT